MPAPDVTLISPYPAGGERHGGFSGVAGYTARLADALADRGAEVTVIAPTEDGAQARERHGNVTVERRFAPGPAALPRAAQAARATGAPVVHLQHETFLYGGPASVPALPGALRLLRRSGLPTVVTMHHVVEPQTVDRAVHPAAPRARTRAASRARDSPGFRRRSAATPRAVVVHEPGLAQAVPGATVIPHGIDVTAPNTRSARERLGLQRRAPAARPVLRLPGALQGPRGRARGRAPGRRRDPPRGGGRDASPPGGRARPVRGRPAGALGRNGGLHRLRPRLIGGRLVRRRRRRARPLPAAVRDKRPARARARRGHAGAAVGAAGGLHRRVHGRGRAGRRSSRSPRAFACWPAMPRRASAWPPPPASSRASAHGRRWPTVISSSTRRCAMPVLLAGAFGQRNPGDEALLAAFVQELCGHPLVATTVRPRADGVRARHRDSVRAGPARRRARDRPRGGRDLRGRNDLQDAAPTQRPAAARAAAQRARRRGRARAPRAPRWRSWASGRRRFRRAARARWHARSSTAPTCSSCGMPNPRGLLAESGAPSPFRVGADAELDAGRAARGAERRAATP